LGKLANLEFFGMWRDREDIRNSFEFARDLRVPRLETLRLIIFIDTGRGWSNAFEVRPMRRRGWALFKKTRSGFRA
jgi:hypothetical protein